MEVELGIGDVKDDPSLKVPLENLNDALYVGTIYLGFPKSQPAKVVFDTGSEYLGITSSLCDDKKAGNFKFKVYSSEANDFVNKTDTNRCGKKLSYNIHLSETGKPLARTSSSLTYGSANCQGFVW